MLPSRRQRAHTQCTTNSLPSRILTRKALLLSIEGHIYCCQPFFESSHYLEWQLWLVVTAQCHYMYRARYIAIFCVSSGLDLLRCYQKCILVWQRSGRGVKEVQMGIWRWLRGHIQYSLSIRGLTMNEARRMHAQLPIISVSIHICSFRPLD